MSASQLVRSFDIDSSLGTGFKYDAPSCKHDRNASPEEKTLEQRCLDHAWDLYPRATSICPLAQQGGCSYTLLVTLGQLSSTLYSNETGDRAIVLQYRPPQFALNLALCRRVHEIYGALVPVVSSPGQFTVPSFERKLYGMSLLPGVRFDSVQPRKRNFDEHDRRRLEVLLRGLAQFFVTGFHAAEKTNQRSCEGKVGSSLVSRLASLAIELPCPVLRSRAASTLAAVKAGVLDALPVVLTHGDLLPSNILVDPDTWALTGLVDWAEAEVLPFGVGMYGVEHLFGCLEDGKWVWYKQANEFRALFWEELVSKVPEVGRELRESVTVAKKVGILLWHGFAWDQGRIDRIVNEWDDREEVEVLAAFLGISEEPIEDGWKGARRDSKIETAC